MRKTQSLLFLTVAAALTAVAADDTAERIGKAVAVFSSLTESGHAIRAEKIASADCIAVIPGFKKGAIVVGVGHGRGFMSCRKGGNWSAPAAVTIDTGSLGVQVGGEEIDLVILSLDPARRAKLLSDRFAIGSDASAAWGNGKAAHEDPGAKIIVYARAKGAFAGFDLDGSTLKPDESGNKALYGKPMSDREIIDGGAETPAVAQPFVAKLAQASGH